MVNEKGWYMTIVIYCLFLCNKIHFYPTCKEMNYMIKLYYKNK